MLEADCISKAYGSTRANDCLTFALPGGEIVGLLGENGAGKSTFLSILAGRTEADSGQLRVDDQVVSIGSPRDALGLGISIVFQHFSLVPGFTVREQLQLAGWTMSGLPDLLVSRLRGDELVGQLSLGEQQMVEIARALASEPRYVLLDEPTSILTSAESENLFAFMRTLRADGTGVILVTHKLHEAMEICDRVVVLRHGRIVDEVARIGSEWPVGCEGRLLRSMFGTAHEDEDLAETLEPASRHVSAGVATRFLVERATTPGGVGRKALHDISFDVRRGEICAVVGIDGHGQRELAEMCAGYTKTSGTITLDGRMLPAGEPRVFKRSGVAYLTDDRIGEGTIPGSSVEANMILKRQRESRFNRMGMLRKDAIRTFVRKMIADWNIVPPRATMPIDMLSGGNIQKVLLARELSIASSMLVVNNPSHGLDVRTRKLVWDAIYRFADEGGGVLLLTTDISEAFQHADRLAVIYEGRISGLERSNRVDRGDVERMMVSGWR